MNLSWKAFWDTYRYHGSISRDTLFEQVGRTINGRPVEPAEFALSIQFVEDKLALQADDVLVEYCCGNGLVSHELAKRVRQVYAFDFTEHLVESARKFRNSDNIEYRLADARAPLPDSLALRGPNKFLMAFALGHFQPDELDQILGNLKELVPSGPIRFLITGVPDAEKQADFYNTAERKARYLEQEAMGDIVKDGIGRWWTCSEIESIAARYRFSTQSFQEPGGTNHFRMAVLMTSRTDSDPAAASEQRAG